MNNVTSNPQELRAKRPYAVFAIALLFILGALGGAFWHQSRAWSAESTRQLEEINALIAEKTSLEHSLDSLNTTLGNARAENEALQGKSSFTADLLAQKDAQIRRLKSQSSRQIGALRKQIADLQQAKTEYETILVVLRAENEQLKAQNEQLKAENAGLRDNNSQLNDKANDLARQLADQVRKTQSARFKAGAFRVEVERRNDKLTTRAKKARLLSISFDLADVPDEFRGQQKLYLVIADENGKPVAATNPTKVSIHAPSGDVPIIAQQTRAVNLVQTQRLSFNYKLEEKIRSGNYMAAVYCDKGLLGASSFRLQ